MTRSWGVLATCIAALLYLRTFVAEPFLTMGFSMHPTFEKLELLLVEKVSWRRERGDVIIFTEPHSSANAMKRIAWLPGETLDTERGPITLGDDEYFVLGDHPGASRDSRHWGPISADDIVGTPLLRIYPFGRVELFPGRI